MFYPELIHLYSHEQLAAYRDQHSARQAALTALVLAGKPRMEALTEVAENLEMIEAELRRRFDS